MTFSWLMVVNGVGLLGLLGIALRAARAGRRSRQAAELAHAALQAAIAEHEAADARGRRMGQLYAALTQCNKAITRCTSADELFVHVCRDAVVFGGMKMAWVGLIDDATQGVAKVAAHGEGMEFLEALQLSTDPALPAGQGPVGRSIRAGEPFWCQDYPNDIVTRSWHAVAARFGWAAMASLPLRRDGKIVGCFVLYSGEAKVFDAATRELLAEMATDIGFALTSFSRAAQLSRLTNFDPLTGLPNRALLIDRVSQAISSAQRHGGSLALMHLDLDHFKRVNDSLNHRVGDELLIQLAARLATLIRPEDTVSRLGADEFVLLHKDVDVADATRMVMKVMDVVRQPFLVDGQDLFVTPSLGIALYPGDGLDFSALLRSADVAMYRAKQSGRNGFCFFRPEMQEHSIRALRLENGLRRAVDLGQLVLHYQPQVSMQTGQIVGAEALVRWQHPELGLISPAEFIPISEATGQIRQIGEWVLRAAVQQMKAWVDLGLAGPGWAVAVNLSPVQLSQQGLPELVTQILAEARLPAAYLELELTESVAMGHPLEAIAVMNELHQRGVRMAIDDFGTGYCSLSYLKRFQATKLKIDQSFVRDLTQDPDDKAIVTAIIGLAGSLGMKTIAEGVETEAQSEHLRQQGCDEAQGYFFSKPLPAQQFEAWALARGARWLVEPSPRLEELR